MLRGTQGHGKPHVLGGKGTVQPLSCLVASPTAKEQKQARYSMDGQTGCGLSPGWMLLRHDSRGNLANSAQRKEPVPRGGPICARGLGWVVLETEQGSEHPGRAGAGGCGLTASGQEFPCGAVRAFCTDGPADPRPPLLEGRDRSQRRATAPQFGGTVTLSASCPRS